MTAWLVDVMHSMGYVGIFLLLVLARVVPPVPAETAIPLAGLYGMHTCCGAAGKKPLSPRGRGDGERGHAARQGG
ncbi:MAG TPA: hypothetical protein VD978_30205 [Azospirillum sp.]|nr:hypothetical protein [Azospirillum sp.]